MSVHENFLYFTASIFVAYYRMLLNVSRFISQFTGNIRIKNKHGMHLQDNNSLEVTQSKLQEPLNRHLFSLPSFASPLGLTVYLWIEWYT